MKLAFRSPWKSLRRGRRQPAPDQPPDASLTGAALTEAALADLAGWRIQRGLLIVGLLALAAVIIVSLHLGEIGEFARRVTATKPAWIAAAVAAQFFAFLFLALAWGVALSSLGARRPARDLFPLTLGTLFADQAIPSAGLSGALFIFHSLTGRGITRDIAITAFILGAASFIAAFALCAIASFAMLALADGGTAVDLAETTGVVILLFLTIGAALAISVMQFRLVRELIGRVPLFRQISAFAARAASSIRAARALFARCTARQLIARGFDVVTLWLCFAAIGERTGMDTAFIAISLASVAATLAPTPMGLGSFEAAMVAILSSLGTSVETALTATLLYRGLSLWAPLSLGFFVVQKELLAQRLPPGATAGKS